MFSRLALDAIENALSIQAAVGLIGPRQVGKTTLAHILAQKRPALYLDLELPSDRAKLSDPELFLKSHSDKLVILDEIHHVPELFNVLRSLIDLGRRTGQATGRFLVLGSACVELLRQSGETLAGRILYIDLSSLNVLEIERPEHIERLWLRGGFPQVYAAHNDATSFKLRQGFIRTYLERDVPQFGPRVSAQVLGRLWTMLAHGQGTLLNASQLASSLSISAPSVSTYIHLLTDLLLVRRLAPYHANVRKRLVKSPKIYIRNSGLLHTLLGIQTPDELAGHPVCGASWEGFVIENVLSVAPNRTQASFYRTAVGAEIDLILELGGANGVWAIEIKRGLAPKPARGFYQGLEDVNPDKTFIVYAGQDRYPKEDGVDVISLRELTQELKILE